MAKRKALGLIDEAVEGVKDLLFMHNTSAKKLARQEAIGGLPNPSIAVTQKDIPFEGFGEITLVGKPDRFDPALKGNPLYSADAYTIRAPSPVRLAKSSATNDFDNDFRAYREFGNVDDPSYNLSQLKYKSNASPYDYAQVSDFLEYNTAASVKFFNDIGVDVPRKRDGDVDLYALSELKMQYADKFDEWKDGLMNKYFDPDEYFVTNPDYDRYSERPNLKPYTAENLSKWMSKNAGAGKESTMTFGAGNLRASTTEQLKSLQDARQRKGLLQSGEEVSVAKSTANEILSDLQDLLKKYYKYETGSFYYFDEVGKMIAESEKIGIDQALKKFDFEDVPNDIKNVINEYRDYLRSAPTEYFESKPERAVQMSDFAGAIVPENTPKGLIDRLTDAGLQVEKYGDEAERVAARNKFKDYMFVRPEAAITAGLLTAGALTSKDVEAGVLSAGTKAARSIGDEVKRLVDMGYPESVAQRIASGELPMDYASIVQRAKEQGYGDITDPANRFYHGTSADIREILNSESGALGGEGVYITPSPEKASGYAQIAERILHRGTSQNVLPLVTNINNPYHFEDYSNIPIGGINDELLRNLGYDALSVSNKGGPVEELKVPSNRVRSVNAAFDPEYVGPNILGNANPMLLAGLAGGSLLGAAVMPKNAEAGPLKNVSKLRNVFPAPQRFFDPEDKAFKPFLGQQFEPQAGGRYLQMGDGAPKDITGEYPNYGLLSVSPEGKPAFQVSDAPAEAGAKTGRKIKTNLFKRKAGWKWTQAPEGFDPDPAGDFPLISVQDGKQHYYTLSTEFPEGVELTRYEKSATEPRLRPTRQGAVELGNVVGEISVRGKKHPVYDRATVKGVAGAGMAIGTAGLTVGSQDVDASLLGVGSTIGKKAEDMLGMAMTMRDRGVDPAEIWNKTGWEFNEYDGRWRTEHSNYESTKINMPEQAGVYPITDVVDDPDLLGAYDNDESANRVMDTYGLDTAMNRKLSSLKVEITPELAPNEAMLDGPLIRVGQGTSPEQFRATILHEMQHSIQENESFAVGGNEDLFRDRRDAYQSGEFGESKQSVERKLGIIRDVIANPPQDASIQQMSELYRMLDRGENKLRAMSAYERDSLQGQRSPYQMYEAMMGEVEARNIEERDQPRGLMREFMPESTEDPRFPRNEQVVMDRSLSPYLDEDMEVVPYRQPLDINYPRQVTVGEAKTPEANYNLLDAVVPAVAAAYDYGDGANFPVRPAQGLLAPEPKAQKSDIKPTPSVVPMGVPINPYTFLMSTGADQGEAARYVTDAYTNIARGAGNAMAGFGGEMETLGKGLMYALTGQGLGGSPFSRFMQVLNKYDPQLPNTQDVSQVPALLPNVSPMTEEERRMYQLAGEFLSPL